MAVSCMRSALKNKTIRIYTTEFEKRIAIDIDFNSAHVNGQTKCCYRAMKLKFKLIKFNISIASSI